jgi:hypothetical protein
MALNRRTLAHPAQLGIAKHCVNLMTFTRQTPRNNDRRLILEAPNKVARRELLLAAKRTNGGLKVLLHLSPQGRENRSYIYHKATR